MDISAEIAAIQAASQGSELRQPLVGALNKLNSGSLPAVTASDAGKILKVGSNGWEVGEKSGYMPVPTAVKQITENGTHDVTDYASAVVNVSGGVTPVLVSKTITQNGTYNPSDDNADGYNEVIVDVQGSSDTPFFTIVQDYIGNTDSFIYTSGKKTVLSWTVDSSDTNTARGIVFDANGHNFRIGFFTNSSGTMQSGACAKDATLPSIIGSGTGRISYTNTTSGNDKNITQDARYNYFIGIYNSSIIGKNVTIIIEDMS